MTFSISVPQTFPVPTWRHTYLLQCYPLYPLCSTLHPCDHFLNANLFFLIPVPLSLGPLTPPLWQPSACSLCLQVCFYFVCSFILFFRFYLLLMKNCNVAKKSASMSLPPVERFSSPQAPRHSACRRPKLCPVQARSVSHHTVTVSQRAFPVP